MRCDDLNLWLDEGMPPGSDAAARAHAASCPACARQLAAFASMEAALALSAPAPPRSATFTARVLERVVPAKASWWMALVSDPVFAVAAVVGIVLLLTPAALRFQAGQSVALPLSVGVEALASRLSAAGSAWFDSISPTETLSPLARGYLLLCFTPILVWCGLWMAGAVDRLFRGIAIRRG